MAPVAGRTTAAPGARDPVALLAFVAMVLVAGGNAVGIHVAADELPIFWAAALRFLVAGALFGGLMLVLRVPIPSGGALLGSVVYGVLGFAVSFALAFWAIPLVGAGAGQTLLALVPLLTLLLAAGHGIERLRLRPVLGAVVSVAGVALLAADRVAAAVPLVGILGALVAAAALAETGVVVKLMPRAHPVSTNAVGMLVGGGLLLALSAVVGEAWRLPTQADTWAAMGFLVVGGSVVVFGLYVFLLGRWTASQVSIEFLLIPLATIVYSALLTGEQITPAFLLGGGVILAGVYIGAYDRSGA